MDTKVEKQIKHYLGWVDDPQSDDGARSYADTDDIAPGCGPMPPPLPMRPKQTPLNTDSHTRDEGTCYLAIGPLSREKARTMLSEIARSDEELNCLLWHLDEENWQDVFPSEATSGDSTEEAAHGDEPAEQREKTTTRVSVESSRLGPAKDTTTEIDIVQAADSPQDEVMDMVVASQVQIIDVDQEAQLKAMPLKEEVPSVRAPTSDGRREKEDHLSTEKKRGKSVSTSINISSPFSISRDDTSPRVTIDERAHNRVRFEVSVTLIGSSNFWTGITRDISSGGLFVATYNILPLGTSFDVTFTLPDGEPEIHGPAEVRWLREYREGIEFPPGMGIKFIDLSAQNQERIDLFVKNRETIFFEE